MSRIPAASPQGKTRYARPLPRLSPCHPRRHKACSFPEESNLTSERNTMRCKHISLLNVRHLLLPKPAISAPANWQPPSEQEDDGEARRLLDAGHGWDGCTQQCTAPCPSLCTAPLLARSPAIAKGRREHNTAHGAIALSCLQVQRHPQHSKGQQAAPPSLLDQGEQSAPAHPQDHLHRVLIQNTPGPGPYQLAIS